MGREVRHFVISLHSPFLSLFSHFLVVDLFFRNRFANPQIPHDASYYSKALIGGALACGVTHAGITPLDVTKCNMQVRSFSSCFYKKNLFFAPSRRLSFTFNL